MCKLLKKGGTFLVLYTKLNKGELTEKKFVDIIFNVIPGNVSSNVSGTRFLTEEKR